MGCISTYVKLSPGNYWSNKDRKLHIEKEDEMRSPGRLSYCQADLWDPIIGPRTRLTSPGMVISMPEMHKSGQSDKREATRQGIMDPFLLSLLLEM